MFSCECLQGLCASLSLRCLQCVCVLEKTESDLLTSDTQGLNVSPKKKCDTTCDTNVSLWLCFKCQLLVRFLHVLLLFSHYLESRFSIQLLIFEKFSRAVFSCHHMLRSEFDFQPFFFAWLYSFLNISITFSRVFLCLPLPVYNENILYMLHTQCIR